MRHGAAAAAGAAIRQQRRELEHAVEARCRHLRRERREQEASVHSVHGLADDGSQLGSLAEALAAESPALFIDHLAWTKVMLTARGLPVEHLALTLTCMGEVLQEHLPEGARAAAVQYVEQGIERLADLPSEAPEQVRHGGRHDQLATRYLEALLRADRRAARQLVLEAVEEGVPIRELYLHVFQRTQHEVGRLWQMDRLSIAQEHFCTAATQQIIAELYPHIFAAERVGHVLVMACVGDELHEIGARMVADFFEMEGWDTFYLGASATTDRIVQVVAERKADVLGLSATMIHHVARVREVVDAMRSRTETADVKILVGGYPFLVDAELGQRIGADGTARSADGAVALAHELVRPG